MSSSLIKLEGSTSVKSVANWPRDSSAVTFLINRRSGFGLFSEGVSLGVLKGYKIAGRDCEIKTSFPIATCGDMIPECAVPFQSLFGISAAYAASHVIDSQGDQSRNPLIEALWSFVRKSQGEFGDGKRRYVVFRDPDYSVPQCLRAGSDKAFPNPSDFNALIRRMWRSLAGEPTAGLHYSEAALISFLYEAVRNSYEHGRFDTRDATIPGIRGIIAEKHIFTPKAKAEIRKGIPQQVADYIERIRKADPLRTHIIIGFTVSDVGLGIQNTLPALENETPWRRLNRAFLDGQSRKPKGTELQRGLGLSKLCRAAARLRAFLFVSSADLIGYRDYSPGIHSSDFDSILHQAAPIPGRLGTSITLLWPIVR